MIVEARYILILPWLFCLLALPPALFAQADKPLPTGRVDPVTGAIIEPVDPSKHTKPQPPVEDLGGNRYRIGEIRIDKGRGFFVVPGTMLANEDGRAIEFLATTRRGYKAYESVISLDADAYEFNLACILIGLDASHAVTPEYHFDPSPLEGDHVSISISWLDDDKRLERDALELLKLEEGQPVTPSVWTYTGSAFNANGGYMAQIDGVLIGLVHDPSSIIEHREGLGLGNWGALTVNNEIAPAQGHAVEIRVQRQRR